MCFQLKTVLKTYFPHIQLMRGGACLDRLDKLQMMRRKNANFIFIRTFASLTHVKTKVPLSFGCLVPEQGKIHILDIRQFNVCANESPIRF